MRRHFSPLTINACLFLCSLSMACAWNLAELESANFDIKFKERFYVFFKIFKSFCWTVWFMFFDLSRLLAKCTNPNFLRSKNTFSLSKNTIEHCATSESNSKIVVSNVCWVKMRALCFAILMGKFVFSV